MKYFQKEDNFKKYCHIPSVLKYGQLKSEKPFVSIVITTYKRPETLREALDSALNQSGYDDYEVIVLDNDVESNTETDKLVRNYKRDKLLYYKNVENLGMVGNWNRGIELARGEWVTILHDDDMLHPRFLQKMVNVLKNNPEIVMLVSDVHVGEKIVFPDVNHKVKIKKNKLAKYIVDNITPFPGVLFKKENAWNLGGFKNDCYPCSDYEFWINYHIAYGSHMLFEKLAFYRFNVTNESNNVYLDIILKSYDIKTKLAEKVEDIPAFVKKILINLGMRNIIYAYEKYYKSIDEYKHIMKKYRIFDNFITKLSYRALNRCIYIISRCV